MRSDLPMRAAIAVCMVMVLMLGGCFGKGAAEQAPSRPDKPTVPLQVDNAKQDIQDARTALTKGDGSAKVIVEGMNPGNVEARKPTAVAKILEADTKLQRVEEKTLPAVKATAMEDNAREQAKDAKIEELEAADPVRRSLEVSGYALIGLGILAVVAAFFVPALLRKHILSAGIASIAVGLTAATVAHYLNEIRLAIAVTLGIALVSALVMAILYAIRNRRLLFDAVKGIEAGKAAGQIIFTPEASDPNKSAVKLYTADETQAMVNAIQGKQLSSSALPGAAPTAPASGGGK